HSVTSHGRRLQHVVRAGSCGAYSQQGISGNSRHRGGPQVFPGCGRAGPGRQLPMDAITLLKNDHKAVKRLFREFNQMGDRASASKRQAVDKIIEELSAHSAIEEQLFYPFVRDTVKG